jgi:hypothetical protein
MTSIDDGERTPTRCFTEEEKDYGKKKKSSLSTAVRYLYSTGGGGVDLVRPRRVVDPVAMACPPSCFQARG